MIGERGPELFRPSESRAEMVAARLRGQHKDDCPGIGCTVPGCALFEHRVALQYAAENRRWHMRVDFVVVLSVLLAIWAFS